MSPQMRGPVAAADADLEKLRAELRFELERIVETKTTFNQPKHPRKP